MEDKRKYHIIVGSKTFFDSKLPSFSEDDEVDAFLGVGKAIGYRKAESSDI